MAQTNYSPTVQVKRLTCTWLKAASQRTVTGCLIDRARTDYRGRMVPDVVEEVCWSSMETQIVKDMKLLTTLYWAELELNLECVESVGGWGFLVVRCSKSWNRVNRWTRKLDERRLVWCESKKWTEFRARRWGSWSKRRQWLLRGREGNTTLDISH